VLLRWLLPIFTVFALLGQAVTSYAAAGVIGEPSCCCPIKAKCKCHDHDGDKREAPTLKRCGGEAKIVAPAVTAAIAAIDFEVTDEPRIHALPPSDPPPLIDDVAREPEKPPF